MPDSRHTLRIRITVTGDEGLVGVVEDAPGTVVVEVLVVGEDDAHLEGHKAEVHVVEAEPLHKVRAVVDVAEGATGEDVSTGGDEGRVAVERPLLQCCKELSLSHWRV